MFCQPKTYSGLSRQHLNLGQFVRVCGCVFFLQGVIKKLGYHYLIVHSVNSVDELLEDVVWSVRKDASRGSSI